MNIKLSFTKLCLLLILATASPLGTVAQTDVAGNKFGSVVLLSCDFNSGLFGYHINADSVSVAIVRAHISNAEEVDVTIPSSVEYGNRKYAVTDIAGNLFSRMENIATITIPASIKNIGRDAFRYSRIERTQIEDLSAWCAINFENHAANPASASGNLYMGDEQITELVIPEGTTHLANYAFDGISTLRSVSFPEGLRVIGRGVFYGCSGLTEVTLPNSIVTIDRNAFEHCSGLESVYIGDNAAFIGYNAFSFCGKLKTVSMPKGVRTVRYNAFADSPVKITKRKIKK